MGGVLSCLDSGHSSGGFAATASAIPELLAKKRKEDMGGIIGIFYAAAFLIPVGASVHTFFQPRDGSYPVIPPYCDFHDRGFAGVASTIDGAAYFFNGLDADKAKYYESTLTASPAFFSVLENDAYAPLPCTYLITDDDMALPAAYQEGMVALRNQRPQVNIGVVRCSSGHSPQLTWTEGLVAELQKFGKPLLG
ncbi:hypothetical protein LARI1_G003974 [Lachnellula arida]|uniref:AB hydrolase-1 domain-containing protein n=1 Tax=Lachnellula arida TaxID=1316785 RepID=A0A8T9BHU1_9HELO|nr:hypothetical protein LARI1_G003974 [Lachnellula arida]